MAWRWVPFQPLRLRRSHTGRPKAPRVSPAAMASYLIFRRSPGARRRASMVRPRRALRRAPRPRRRVPAPSAPDTRSDMLPSQVYRPRTPSPPQVVWRRIGTSRRNQTEISTILALLLCCLEIKVSSQVRPRRRDREGNDPYLRRSAPQSRSAGGGAGASSRWCWRGPRSLR